MPDPKPLYIPVILGTVRMGRMSERAARVVFERVQGRPGVETELVDIATMPLRTDDAGEDIKDPAFSAKLVRADAIVIVTPEYNRSFPGMLKHVLDAYLKEYIHKAAGIVAVSAGPWGGTRVIEGMLPTLRELGLVTIFWDVHFPSIHKLVDADGKLLDPTQLRRIDKFLAELEWMATVLRYGRENVALGS